MKKKPVAGKTFSERVVEAVMTIPSGRVTTYGRLARACGAGPMASQSITGILAKAHREQGLAISFHRIVYANGTIWVSDEYRTKRLALYKKEGIIIEKGNKIKNFNDIVFDFK
jgi:alkylated DNA nucleotide flippase Atl1